MEIELASGRKARIERLEQWTTYGGLLAGRPDSRLNRGHVDDLQGLAERASAPGGSPYIVMPSDAAIATRLPAVTCLGVLISGPLGRADSEPYSSLVVGWFQDKFALPLDEAVERAIRLIDWEEKAKDWLS